MASFLEKLKKGMDTEGATLISTEEENPIKEEEPEETEEEEKAAEGDEEPEETEEDEEVEVEEEAASDESSGEPMEEESAESFGGPREISVEEMEEKLAGSDSAEPRARNASVKSLANKLIIEDDEPRARKKKALSKFSAPKKIMPESNLKIKSKDWFYNDGQLVVDVYEANGYIVIKSAIAGISPKDIDISIEKDTVTIKGERREADTERGRNYFHQECYWGSFRREIILPDEVDGGRTEASMKNGILTIKVPKVERERKKISIK